MEVLFTGRFEKQIEKIKEPNLAKRLKEIIIEVINASSINEVKNSKKLKGATNAYRIRLGDFRIGLYVMGNVVEFSCFLHRKDVYKYFP